MTGPSPLAIRSAWAPTLRAAPRRAPAVLGCAGMVIVALTFLWREPQMPADQFSVRIALLLLGAMVVWCFEDPAGELLAPTPVGRTHLRALRAGSAVALWAIALGIVLLLAGAGAETPRYLLEATTIMSLALAIAAGAARTTGPESGRIGAGGLLVLFAATFLFPRGRALWDAATMDDRTAVTTWSALLVVGAVAAVIMILEPWTSPRKARRRPHPSPQSKLPRS